MQNLTTTKLIYIKDLSFAQGKKKNVHFALGNGTTSSVMINFDVLPENRSTHVYVERIKICVLKIVENVLFFLPDFVGLKSIFC